MGYFLTVNTSDYGSSGGYSGTDHVSDSNITDTEGATGGENEAVDYIIGDHVEGYTTTNYILTTNTVTEMMETPNSDTEMMETTNSATEIIKTQNSATDVIEITNSATEAIQSQNSATELLQTPNSATKINETHTVTRVMETPESTTEVLETPNSTEIIGTLTADHASTVMLDADIVTSGTATHGETTISNTPSTSITPSVSEALGKSPQSQGW